MAKIKSIAAFAAALTLLLSSCKFPPEFVSTWDNAKKTEDIMDSIKDGGREELAEHFSEYLRTEHYDELLADIDEMYDFLGGDVISYDKPKNCGYSQKSTDHGDITLYISGPDVCNVVTSDGKNLWFAFTYTVIDDKLPENAGLNQIYISYMDREENDDSVIVSGNTEYGLKKKDKE